jgi:SpoVK/Ycf46/Vps4 family AAA+-type ATPase
MDGYRDSREHLRDELHRLDLLLKAHIAQRRSGPAQADFNALSGLLLSEEEIDLLVGNTPRDTANGNTAVALELQRLSTALAQLDQHINRKVALALEVGVFLALPQLMRHFRLAPFDVDALLICLAPEVDRKYETLYAYLHNDVTRKLPSVDLVLQLLCASFEECLEARTRLLPEAPLFRHHFLTCAGDRADDGMLTRPLRIDQRVLHYVLGVETMDAELTVFTAAVTPRVTLDALLLPDDLKTRLGRVFQHWTRQWYENDMPGVWRFLFQGPTGVGKKHMAEALCAMQGLHLLVVDVPLMLVHDAADAGRVARLLREAQLRLAAVYLDHAEILLGMSEKTVRARTAIVQALAGFPGVVFFGSTQPWDELAYPDIPDLFRVVFPAPDFALRRRCWETFLRQEGLSVASDIDVGHLADTFDFTAETVRQAVAEAYRLAMLRDPEAPTITAADLSQACRGQSGMHLGTLARKVTPLYTWEDIVLPPACLEQLREICAHARNRQQVFEQWGFNRKIALGKGLSVLFVGPSGTGKTMAADIIANDLGLELYKIDLSGVVSKYIGETEKNLSQVFDAAERSNVALFFDEADAIFGKRSDVKDAHDRYANIETNYLLQRLEEYAGLVMLASNLPRNIDNAFTRRLRFIVEFPVPDEAHCRRIWQQIFPSDLPRDTDIDFEFLSRKLKMTGGNIKNIALHAAFLAAAEGGVIGMVHIIRATRREFQKMGRLCVKADFEQYFDWVRDD